MKKVSLFIALITITASYSLTAQVYITTDGSAPDGSAMLEVKSTDKGLLIPRVALTGTTDETTISSPALSLMIFNTATAQDVIPGFYYWNGEVWAPGSKTADGSETKVTAGTNITITGVGTTASPYVVNARGASTHSVGDFAHGGIVFWVDENGQHGLVCAKEDQSTGAKWYSTKYFSSDFCTQARGNGPYAGEANTAIIIAVQRSEGENVNYAARICTRYQITEGGTTYGDWYLPSIEELNLMYQNRAIIDSTATAQDNEGFAFSRHDEYWSSTEVDDHYRQHRCQLAWYKNFRNGSQHYWDKYHRHHVRAIRAF